MAYRHMRAEMLQLRRAEQPLVEKEPILFTPHGLPRGESSMALDGSFQRLTRFNLDAGLLLPLA